MDKRIELYWVEKYPNLFPGYHMTVWQTPMARGFTCGNGWFYILDRLWKDLSGFDNLTIGQVKEKFGGLRVYQNPPGLSIVEDLYIELASADAINTCEMCSSLGKRRDGNWIFTLCDNCFETEGSDKWKVSEEFGCKIAKDLNLRTTCGTDKDHLLDFNYKNCIVCKAGYDVKTGGWK